MSITIEPLKAIEGVLNGLDHARRIPPGNRERERMFERSVDAHNEQEAAVVEEAAVVVDKHIAAARILEALGWSFDGLNWHEPESSSAEFPHSEHVLEALADRVGALAIARAATSVAQVDDQTLNDVEAAYKELQLKE